MPPTSVSSTHFSSFRSTNIVLAAELKSTIHDGSDSNGKLFYGLKTSSLCREIALDTQGIFQEHKMQSSSYETKVKLHVEDILVSAEIFSAL